MSYPDSPYRIYPLGDAALTIEFGAAIDITVNREVITRFSQFKEQPLVGMIEAVPAYSSLTIYYDIVQRYKITSKGVSIYEQLKKEVEERLQLPIEQWPDTAGVIRIPVCYEKEFAPDAEWLVAQKNLSIDELIQTHTAGRYRVYMLGFLPGFTYMGQVDERIAVPRKPQPQSTAAGSVGIAGRQTGIYPLLSPGGWQIIGRTPLKLFDAGREEPVLLKAGDTVQFYPITATEFYKLQNQTYSTEKKGGAS
jgi:inhibitor of KinA